MTEEICLKKFSIIARGIAAILLFLALGDQSYGYYKLLRWVTCGAGAYSAFIAVSVEKKFWVWVFGITALIFNPLIPFHFSIEIWSVIDIIAGVLFLISLFSVRET